MNPRHKHWVKKFTHTHTHFNKIPDSLHINNRQRLYQISRARETLEVFFLYHLNSSILLKSFCLHHKYALMVSVNFTAQNYAKNDDGEITEISTAKGFAKTNFISNFLQNAGK